MLCLACPPTGGRAGQALAVHGCSADIAVAGDVVVFELHDAC